jgi:hypothetical protein
MMGHPVETVRDAGIVLLNELYDGLDWQKSGPFNPKITRIGAKFRIDYLIESDYDDNLVIGIKGFLFAPDT